MQLQKGFAVAATVILAAGTAAFAQNHDHKPTVLTVIQPWARATAPTQKAGGVFLRIDNAGDRPDRLIGVETDRATAASLHTMIRDGDVMKMRAIEDGIEVPAKGHVLLAPGSRHVMLMGLRGALVKGSKITLTLIFERAGRLDIEATVEAAGARGPTAPHKHGN